MNLQIKFTNQDPSISKKCHAVLAALQVRLCSRGLQAEDIRHYEVKVCLLVGVLIGTLIARFDALKSLGYEHQGLQEKINVLSEMFDRLVETNWEDTDWSTFGQELQSVSEGKY